eukprot:Gb_09894 [translate_table: standard]
MVATSLVGFSYRRLRHFRVVLGFIGFYLPMSVFMALSPTISLPLWGFGLWLSTFSHIKAPRTLLWIGLLSLESISVSLVAWQYGSSNCTLISIFASSHFDLELFNDFHLQRVLRFKTSSVPIQGSEVLRCPVWYPLFWKFYSALGGILPLGFII